MTQSIAAKQLEPGDYEVVDYKIFSVEDGARKTATLLLKGLTDDNGLYLQCFYEKDDIDTKENPVPFKTVSVYASSGLQPTLELLPDISDIKPAILHIYSVEKKAQGKYRVNQGFTLHPDNVFKASEEIDLDFLNI